MSSFSERIPEQLKAALIAYVKKVIRYGEHASSSEDVTESEWKCLISSSNPDAFHDESSWDDYTIVISADEPVLKDGFQLHEVEQETTFVKVHDFLQDFHYTLYEPCEVYSKFSFCNDYQHIIETYIKVMLDSLNPHDSAPIWITITQDRGSF